MGAILAAGSSCGLAGRGCGWSSWVRPTTPGVTRQPKPCQQRFVVSAGPRVNEAGGCFCPLCASRSLRGPAWFAWARQDLAVGCLGWESHHSFNWDLSYWLGKEK